VQDAVKVKLDEDQEELDEIMKRRCCLVIHGLKKSSSPDPHICYKEDEENIVNMLHYIKCDEVSVRNAVRLGRRPDKPEDKPRPLKLTIASEEQK
jgi:hypothetical protein